MRHFGPTVQARRCEGRLEGAQQRVHVGMRRARRSHGAATEGALRCRRCDSGNEPRKATEESGVDGGEGEGLRKPRGEKRADCRGCARNRRRTRAKKGTEAARAATKGARGARRRRPRRLVRTPSLLGLLTWHQRTASIVHFAECRAADGQETRVAWQYTAHQADQPPSRRCVP